MRSGWLTALLLAAVSAQESPYRLGETFFAGEGKQDYYGRANAAPPDLYRFEFSGDAPKLVYFWIDLVDRDNLPVDVSLFRRVDGKDVPYTEGEDPVALPHEVQALPGNKFTTRILREKGTYVIRVQANHPGYKLRSRIYDIPPYSSPQQAVRTALDYLLGAGDSWHANTPRRGGVTDRVMNPHQETTLCVACHPTHFSQRASLYAMQKGYPVHMRAQQQFLAERFYNNPRPFYGFEGQASWARVISAPANVLGRMGHLMDLYEKQLGLPRRTAFHDGIDGYLKLYYDGRTALPGDETNGNTPLVSAHEVAWYAWEHSRDPKLPDMVAQAEVKNMVDLCYQTLALASMDRAKYADRIRANADRILSLQRDSGQWPMKFGPREQEAEFQTGHALWALHAAGVPRENPQVAKGLAYLLKRQQEFGAWMDPLQSYENFRTPFRETQMAVLALSSYYPAGEAVTSWQSKAGSESLQGLDEAWDERPAWVAAWLKKPDPIARREALEAIGRRAAANDAELVAPLLGDPSRMVRRTAAWAMRMVYSQHPAASLTPLLRALDLPDAASREGALRVFSHHFAALAARPEAGRALLRRTADSVPELRMEALKGVWRLWFWTADDALRSQLEDAVLAAVSRAEPPIVERNAREALYNIADENIRYLYNNWVPLLANASDQERVIRGRLRLESRLAQKWALALEKSRPQARRQLLRAMVEFPLRRADVYDPKADLSAPPPPVYNRIGNDIEQTVFFGESADRVGAVLLRLIDDSDAETRRLAHEALLTVRDPKFGAVEKIAGVPEVRAAVRQALEPRQKEYGDVWRAFRPPQPMTAQGARPGARSSRQRPDEAYFRGYVQPILEKRGRDGAACVHCHATHTLFDGTYAKALNVVDVEDPERSLILRKPISSAETEGIAGSSVLPHGGGIRFERGSPEYNTILEWIRGAKP